MTIKEKAKKFYEDHKTVIVIGGVVCTAAAGVFVGNKISLKSMQNDLYSTGINFSKDFVGTKKILSLRELMTFAGDDDVLAEMFKDTFGENLDEEIKSAILLQKKSL